MPSIHNAVSDTVYALGLEHLIQDVADVDPNVANGWTVWLLPVEGVASVHPLANVTLTISRRDDGVYEVQVQGRDTPWGVGIERQFCRVLTGALSV